MSELKTITIDGVDHAYAGFTDEQKLYVAHLNDVQQNMARLKFQLDQLQVTKDTFVGMLKNSLDTKGT